LIPVSPYTVLDERFLGVTLANVHLENALHGVPLAEGPAYFAAGRYLFGRHPNDQDDAVRRDRWLGVGVPPAQPQRQWNTVDAEGRLSPASTSVAA